MLLNVPVEFDSDAKVGLIWYFPPVATQLHRPEEYIFMDEEIARREKGTDRFQTEGDETKLQESHEEDIRHQVTKL